MTGPEHYREAERLGHMAQGQELAWAMFTVAQAQVHATLALAAATAINDYPDGAPIDDARAWRDAAGVWKPGSAQ